MLVRGIVTVIVIMLVTGCASRSPGDLSTRLIGTWQSTLAGFTFKTTYTPDNVSVSGETSSPWALEGDLLIVDGDRTTARRVAFESRDEMIQTDVITGTAHRYTRLSP